MYLFLDFDETLSSHDTLSLIPSPPPSPSSSSSSSSSSTSQPDPKDFSSYTQAYLSDMRDHEASYGGERDTIRGQLRFLGSLADVERKSVARVEKGGLFVGWTQEDAEKRGREGVRLRRGVRSSEMGQAEQSTLQEFLQRTTSTSTSGSGAPQLQPRVLAGIISVSWSTVFVRASLQPLPLHFVYANDPVLDPITKRGTGALNKGAAEGEQEGGIRTGLDKLRLMRREMSKAEEKRLQNASAQQGKTHSYSVYAGDSNTDLPCLIEASLGLILGEGASLLSTLERIGLRGRVLDGYEALQMWLKAGEEGKGQGEGKGAGGSLRPVDPKRTEPWSEEEEERRAEEVCLVRVKDWVEGTKVLELVLALEEGRSM
ncbi:hypothetical protein BCV69DRAFT_298624 [Microstroma glucosiphilum]|uniref:HAD-like protein n=1 Tax=Pseudomicrostroma glucosiphilum TaxID=1684307 RepID=A0A316UB49_9BASI|nr:hypothetical protein BCV69DRAFT_298624 [Pseudomicrostroma glucosiphilum]PWN21623.1 hypothetical protein BCV69DRAFT_298624 [Pseudomicrostroma glucosiphilum]